MGRLSNAGERVSGPGAWRTSDTLDIELPQYLPVVYPTQNGKAEIPLPRSPCSPVEDAPRLDLSALLAQVLLAFTMDFEQESRISLPISATTLRVLSGSAVRVADLPRLTGVSKEANAISVGFLARHDCAVVEPIPTATRGKLVRLTPKGQRAQDKYRRVLEATEATWTARYGATRIAAPRAALERLIEDTNGPDWLLYQSVKPYPDGWRASRRRPDTLPHYPMVRHRGGHPDGS
jgi:hypothetical protein